MWKLTSVSIFVFSLACFLYARGNSITRLTEPSLNEYMLHARINTYRKNNNLPAIPFSKSLTRVAQIHARDLALNRPDRGKCNMHSWSDQGEWTPCCYTPDHKQVSCIYTKPRELTDYPGRGYENAAKGGNSSDPGSILELWEKSPPHNNLILNRSIWKNSKWQSLGVGIYEEYAVMWVGEETDPAGYWPSKPDNPLLLMKQLMDEKARKRNHKPAPEDTLMYLRDHLKLISIKTEGKHIFKIKMLHRGNYPLKSVTLLGRISQWEATYTVTGPIQKGDEFEFLIEFNEEATQYSRFLQLDYVSAEFE